MGAGVILAAAVLAQAGGEPAAAAPPADPTPVYGPAAPPPPKPPGSAATANKDCSPDVPDPTTGAIVVCVVKPNGYRIDPDVLAATKLKKKEQTGGPRPPERYADVTGPVGPPYGCMGVQCVNIVGVALTAAQMASKLAQGATVGSVLKTQPEGSSEYQYYQQAKIEREQKQVEKAAKAYAARVEAEEKAQAQPVDKDAGEE